MKFIAVDREALLSLAQQMESGMIVGPVLAKDLGALVKAAPAAVPAALIPEIVIELESYGHCRNLRSAKEADQCECRHCRLLRDLKLATSHNQESVR